jgi:hypothetical protein
MLFFMQWSIKILFNKKYFHSNGKNKKGSKEVSKKDFKENYKKEQEKLKEI